MQEEYYYIYVATSPRDELDFEIKIGHTGEPYGRLETYHCGNPRTYWKTIQYKFLWKTTARTFKESEDFEEEVHIQFSKNRINETGKSEWFKFDSLDMYDLVRNFVINKDWFVEELLLEDIPRIYKTVLNEHRNKPNTNYINDWSKRKIILDQFQQPVIEKIQAFVSDPNIVAGCVIAPCGSGKTVMACKGVSSIQRMIICCPSNQIQLQWRDTLIEYKTFDRDEILLIGSAPGTTDELVINKHVHRNRYCLLTTYKSSNLLVNNLDTVQLLILDEAHHMAGIISSSNIGDGMTRFLLTKVIERKIKRLSLTYTPRYILCDETAKYYSMDDREIFGDEIASLKIRILINAGVLPDYRIWMLQTEKDDDSAYLFENKARTILHAWGETEVINSKRQYILHHLIIFVRTIDQIIQVQDYFEAQINDGITEIIGLTGKLDTNEQIEKFNKAKRAIIINCNKLGEGVDTPIANAVAIMYPKESRGQITQMLLRPGRWYQDKPIFHILLPINKSSKDDYTGFEEVLLALASQDDKIKDEIMLKSKSDDKDEEAGAIITSLFKEKVGDQRIIIEKYGSNEQDVLRCFESLRTKIVESMDVQKICREYGIDTSVDYIKFKEQYRLPENPKSNKITWYDFLHPGDNKKIQLKQFHQTVIVENKILKATDYEIWLRIQDQDKYPSIQYIVDGYFGNNYNNYNSIVNMFFDFPSRRGR